MHWPKDVVDRQPAKYLSRLFYTLKLETNSVENDNERILTDHKVRREQANSTNGNDQNEVQRRIKDRTFKRGGAK